MVRICFNPTCGNDSSNSPNKIFVRIREDLRKKWCREVNTKYFKVCTMYCCEDHFDPKVDLKNYPRCKLMNEEPIFKPTATLKNIHMGHQNQPDVSSSMNHPELSMLLMQPIPESTATYSVKKRKHEDIIMPSTSASTLPLKVNVGIQCQVLMMDKSTHFKSRKVVNTTSPVFDMPSSQESSSAAAYTTPSLFGFTSETEELQIETTKVKMQKNMLEIMFKKPKMYLGLPKQYLWIINYMAQKSTTKINSLCLIVTLFKIKQNDSIERISDQLELSRTKLSVMILQGIEILANFFQNLILCPSPKLIKKNLPLVFKVRFSNVQMIIDCFEIQIAKPSDPLKQAQTWSQYKNCNTVKYLIGCTPNGLVSFISKGYGGRISDKAIVEKSNLLNILQPNTVLLADRGFKEIESLLGLHGIKLLRNTNTKCNLRGQANIY